MKKSLFVLTIIIMLFSAAACSVHAQFARQGVVEFGGSIAYSSTTTVSNGNTASNSTSILNFLPYVNYFLTDGFSVALSPGINYLKYANLSDGITNLDLFVVPGYTFNTNSMFYPYVEGLIGYTSLTSNSNPLGGTSSLNQGGVSWGLKGGVKYLIGKNGLFSVGIAYTQLNFSPKGASNRTGANDIALSMGFSVFIDK